MDRKHVGLLTTILAACAVGLAGCASTQSAAVKKPLPILKMSTTWSVKSNQGIRIQFNHPVRSVEWTWNGKTQTTNLSKPTKTVWLPVMLPQNKNFSITIDQAVGPSVKEMTRHHTLTGKTPAPLEVSTDPGIWQFNVSRTGPFTLHFSAPVADKKNISKEIHFSPAIQGTIKWTNATTAEFIPSQTLPPTESVTMTIQGGVKGVAGTDGQYLEGNATRPFITASDKKIVVSEDVPETLTLYEGNKVLLKTKCNTGVTGATTPTGDFYIHAKMEHTDMSGVDPDGTKYSIKNVPWVMQLFGNTAIHGYQRSTYGFAQSNGCIELPIQTAEKLYSMVDVGTPVVIEK